MDLSRWYCLTQAKIVGYTDLTVCAYTVVTVAYTCRRLSLAAPATLMRTLYVSITSPNHPMSAMATANTGTQLRQLAQFVAHTQTPIVLPKLLCSA